ncbi:MAG: chromosome segregation protein SMC [Anaerolineales bacterium]|nr:chromosome segregation protein SMC [Anaerolineales bacterium]
MTTRLKSLELQGYKTFANRTLFEYAGAITAIVGPNGSGKSNIADSIRWVLGEQSYSLLRGKKTEDMIFSGSEHRPRSGMASVTMVFDNESGWLPIEFGEVAVTRRAYRDGQNEYLLNGQKVRLKDISELLANSGLAERTYTLIGQGLVDEALALKADERRRLFEEAAGIGLHRTRKEEALRRLDATHRNLDRVKDILAELEPRLRSLERQARRAGEFDQVKIDLRAMLRDWYGFHWHKAQSELLEAREEARGKQAQVEEIRQQQMNVSSQLLQSRQKIQELRSKLSNLHSQLSILHSSREENTREQAVTDERIRSVEEQMQILKQEEMRLDEEVTIYRQQESSSAREVQLLVKDLEETRSQLESVKQDFIVQNRKRRDIERTLQLTQKELDDTVSEINQLNARLNERDNQATQQKAALNNLSQTILEAHKNAEEAKRMTSVVEKELSTAEDSSKRFFELLEIHRKNQQNIDKSRQEKINALNQEKAHLAQLQARLDVLDQADKGLEGYSNGAQVLLKAVRSGNLKGFEKALGNYMDVPQDLEKAVAAALGSAIEAVILEPDNNIDTALDLLAEREAQGILAPVELINVNNKTMAFQRDPYVLGVASQMVAIPPEFSSLVNLLLGNVLIVKDRETAKKVISKQKGEIRAVTLHGDIFYSNGLIEGRSGSQAGAITRTRERKELLSKIGALKEKIQKTQTRLEELDHQLTEAKVKEETLGSSLNQARVELENARNKLFQTKESYNQIERDLKNYQNQSSQLENDIQHWGKNSHEMQEQIEGLENKKSTFLEKIEVLSAELKKYSLHELQTQTTHWETRVLLSEKTFKDANTRLEDRRNLFAKSKQLLENNRVRQRALSDELIKLKQNKSQLQITESANAQDIEQLSRLIEPSEKEMAEQEKTQDSQLLDEAKVRQLQTVAERNFTQARIALAHRQESLESLQRRVEDDFGLVSYEYAEDISGPKPLPLEGLVEELPRIKEISPELEENIRRQRVQLRRIGAINPEAQQEYQEVKLRFSFLNEQIVDLEKAEADIRKVIRELDDLMANEFQKTFNAVQKEFGEIFSKLFGGGSAKLLLTLPDDLTETGIDIEARLPGKRMQGLSLLSGGERSLTATALIFALLKVAPTPFCLLDEVDAMLDESNVGRFRDLLKELSDTTQFIVVTHNRNTVQVADVIYGVTMGRDSTSQVISLKLDEIDKVVD